MDWIWHYLSPQTLALWILILLVAGLLLVFVITEYSNYCEDLEENQSHPPKLTVQAAQNAVHVLQLVGVWEITDIIQYWNTQKDPNLHGHSLKLLQVDPFNEVYDRETEWKDIEVFFPSTHPQEKSIPQFVRGERIEFQIVDTPYSDIPENIPSRYLSVQLA